MVQGNYFQAECKGIDVAKRVLNCSYNKCQVSSHPLASAGALSVL